MDRVGETGGSPGWAATLPAPLRDAASVAVGASRRPDPVRPRTGGPAGNARLTAWLGLLLLVLFLAELVTLLDVRSLITWHLVLGLLLVPPSVAKTATTAWRVAGYYRGAGAYVQAGPPPLLLRLLGPLVVAGTLSLLGTGIVVALVGPSGSDRVLLTLVGQRISVVTLHQAAFVVWAVATGLHVLGRLLPAVDLVRSRQRDVPGHHARVAAVLTVAAAAPLLTVLLMAHLPGWHQAERPRFAHGQRR